MSGDDHVQFWEGSGCDSPGLLNYMERVDADSFPPLPDGRPP